MKRWILAKIGDDGECFGYLPGSYLQEELALERARVLERDKSYRLEAREYDFVNHRVRVPAHWVDLGSDDEDEGGKHDGT